MKILPIVLITDDRQLALDYTNDFTEADKIALILESPRIEREDYKAELLRINNTLAILRPEILIYGNINRKIDKLLTPKMGNIKIIRALKKDDWKHIVNKENQFNNMGTAEFSPTFSKFSHIIAYEYLGDINDIIIQNLAIAMQARLIALKTNILLNSRDMLNLYYRYEETNNPFTRAQIEEKLDSFYNIINDSIGDISKSSSITFITRGLPLGVFFKIIPSCHLSIIMLGYQIARILAAEYLLDNTTNNAILIDPGKTRTNELKSICGLLKSKKCITKKLFGSKAIVIDVMFSLEFLPYELCIISTHCGEVSGVDQTFIFTASDNKRHSIRLWAVYAFAPHYDKNEMVTVQTLHIPRVIDGINWEDKEKLAKIDGGELYSEFKDINPLETKVINHGKIKKVPFSQTLQMHDHEYMPRFHGFNSILPPFFINNSCFSSYDMAENFMFGGARGYIGTINSVQTWVAEDIINAFFKQDSSLPIATCLWLAQKKVYNSNQYFQYTYSGLPLTTLKFSNKFTNSIKHEYYNKLCNIHDDYKRKLNTPEYQDIKERTINVINFYKREIKIFRKKLL